jgi:Ca2+-binding RTX toxin-like protein
MATLTWSGPDGFDLRNIDFSNLPNGYSYTRSSSLFVVKYNASGNTRDEFRGTGFTYDAQGIPTGGVVKSYAAILDGDRVGYASGVNIGVTSLVAAASTTSQSDDLRVLRSALSGNDRITGGNGNDRLEGFAGNDILRGRGGADKLFGGTGADTFTFKSVRESTTTSSGRDTIYDFSVSQKDKIDLSTIDARTNASGNQAFSFIGTGAFSGKAGELRYEKAPSDTYISGDVNGDKVADFTIRLDDRLTLSSNYFVL